MSEPANALQSLTRSQRVRLGGIALVIGIALIGVLGFAPIPSVALQIVIGTIGVLVMVAGTLLLGTSEGAV
jgi:hypothetical protein